MHGPENHTHYHSYPQSRTPDRVKMAARMIGHYQDVTDPEPMTRHSYDGVQMEERDGRELKPGELAVQSAALEVVRHYITGEITDEPPSDLPEWMLTEPDYPGWFVFLDRYTLRMHLQQNRVDNGSLEVRIAGYIATGERPQGAWLEIPPVPFDLSLIGQEGTDGKDAGIPDRDDREGEGAGPDGPQSGESGEG